MIIGVSGRIGSGKDTVGKIIQYLTSKELNGNIKIEHYLSNCDICNKDNTWEIKKFAGKLKQITALLTGCTIEQLEDQDFKKQYLGESWRKTTGVMSEQGLGELMTYRELLQKLGTEAMRDGLHTNVWVNALFADYKSEYTTIFDSQKTDNPLPTQVPTNELAQNPNWIITDMRFPNEFDAVKARDGITIRVNRPDTKEYFQLKNRDGSITHATLHPSETSLDNHKFDYVIDNDGSISDLIDKVKEILIKSKII